MALTYQLIVLLGLSIGLWMGANAGCPSDCCMICPGGWVRHDDRCFQFVKELKVWSDAEDGCQARGSTLASALSASDATFLRGLAKPNGNAERVWLGCYEIKPNAWKWTSGDDFVQTYLWAQGEPNNQHGTPEKCMEIQIVNENNVTQPINDAPCDVKKAYICVRDMITA